MTDIDPQFVPRKPLPRFYASASKSYQDELDGFDNTDPEQVLNRQDSERDYAHRQNHDDDVATPCYEQDDDYTEDRFPAINENQRVRIN
jgi:hypothetical protein